MFWDLVGAILFVTVVLPILLVCAFYVIIGIILLVGAIISAFNNN
jgi:hypothetical protein